MKKYFLYCFIFIFLFCFSVSLKAATEEKIIIGIVSNSFGVDPTTVYEACRPFCIYITKKSGIMTDFIIYPDMEAFKTGLDTGKINFGIGSNIDYLHLKKEKDITPLVKGYKGGVSTYKAVILVRNDSGINSVDDLKGKKFAFSSQESAHGYLYPSLLVKNTYNKSLDEFFGEIIKTQKDCDNILSVYYKKADVASVPTPSFDLMATLKPLLKRKLKVIATSKPYCYSPVFYYRKNIKNQSTIDTFNNAVLNMHMDPDGSQVLMLMKLSKLVPAVDADYDNLRNLHNQLKKFDKNFVKNH